MWGCRDTAPPAGKRKAVAWLGKGLGSKREAGVRAREEHPGKKVDSERGRGNETEEEKRGGIQKGDKV